MCIANNLFEIHNHLHKRGRKLSQSESAPDNVSQVGGKNLYIQYNPL